jgi:hypothetical protein
MEGERGKEQEAYIQAYVRLPPEQVHQSRSKGLGDEMAKTFGEARMPETTEVSKIGG